MKAYHQTHFAVELIKIKSYKPHVVSFGFGVFIFFPLLSSSTKMSGKIPLQPKTKKTTQPAQVEKWVSFL